MDGLDPITEVADYPHTTFSQQSSPISSIFGKWAQNLTSFISKLSKKAIIFLIVIVAAIITAILVPVLIGASNKKTEDDFIGIPMKDFIEEQPEFLLRDPNCLLARKRQCIKCKEFYVLNQQTSRCDPITCECDFGIGISDGLCPSPAYHDCQTCNLGYKLTLKIDPMDFSIKRVCKPNSCVCDNGVVSSDVRGCVSDGGQNCADCNEDYYLDDGKMCQKNVCICENGEIDDEENCAEHGRSNCKSDGCEQGFTFAAYDKTCKKYECPANHKIDLSNPSNLTCVPNQCFCENGTPFDVDLDPPFVCDLDGKAGCSSCDQNYKLDSASNSYSCLPKICSCTNGTAFQAGSCPNENIEQCEICEPPFSLIVSNLDDSRKCEKIDCQCPNGRINTVAICSLKNNINCKSCDTGYFLNDITKTCELNQCTCDNGLGTSGLDCPVNNQTRCDRNGCNSGYNFRFNKCFANSCTCINGNPIVTGLGANQVSGEEVYCPISNGNFCKDCTAGYRLEPMAVIEIQTNYPQIAAENYQSWFAVCHKNDCVCQNGTPRDPCLDEFHQENMANPDYFRSYCSACDSDNQYSLTLDDTCCAPGECKSCAGDAIHLKIIDRCYAVLSTSEQQLLINSDHLNFDPVAYRSNPASYIFELGISASINQEFYNRIVISDSLDVMTIKNLQNLTIRADLAEIGQYLFYDLQALTKLTIDSWANNKISRVMFYSNSNLEFLTIRNTNLKEIEDSSFGLNGNLKKIDFSQNQIETIKTETFGLLPDLTELDLSDNSITSIQTSSFRSLESLSVLKLQNNQLVSFVRNQLPPKLVEFNLGGNLGTIQGDDAQLCADGTRLPIGGAPIDCFI